MTLTRVVTVARSERVFFLTMTIVTSRLAHDGHNRDQFFSNPGVNVPILWIVKVDIIMVPQTAMILQSFWIILILF